jgi:cell division protein FtsB
MLQKTKIILIEFFKNLTDLRYLGQVFFVILALLLSWSGVKAIQSNYELQKQIVRLEQEVEIQKLENENLKLSNQYLETDQFLELAARRQFGKGAPGETLLVVPKETAMQFVTQTAVASKKKSSLIKPKYQQNLEAWVNFFFRKSQNRLLQ